MRRRIMMVVAGVVLSVTSASPGYAVEKGWQERVSRQLGGDRHLRDEWRRGYRSATVSLDPDIGVYAEPGSDAFRCGWNEGLYDRIIKGTGEIPIAAWPAARFVASEYAGRITTLNEMSVKLAGLLEEASVEFTPAEDADSALQLTLDRTRYALERATITRDTHAAFQEAAYRAFLLHPILVGLLKRSAEQLDGRIEKLEYKDSKQSLHIEKTNIDAMVDGLVRSPVTVPANFDAMGRHISESILVMEQAIEVGTMRQTLAVENISNAAMTLGLGEYAEMCRAWREGQFRDWQEGRLSELIRSLGGKPTPAAIKPKPQKPPAVAPASKPPGPQQTAVAPSWGIISLLTWPFRGSLLRLFLCGICGLFGLMVLFSVGLTLEDRL